MVNFWQEGFTMLAAIRSKFRKYQYPSVRLLRKYRLSRFQQKVPIFFETEQFILKTAENPFEVRRALEMRHEIFYKELQGKELAHQLDIDALDTVCDHLLIIDKDSRQIVGTYRIVCSLFAKKFYSQAEFEMEKILAHPGVKLELGRACIKREFRTGGVLTLLWRGIVEYVKQTNAELVFGCASVQTADPLEAAAVYDFLLQRESLRLDMDIKPTKKYRVSFVHSANPYEGKSAIELTPPLLMSYLKAGAKAAGLPAYDRDFQCFDFFMLLKVEDFSKIFRRRYGLDSVKEN
jgi:putative hemolysin